MTYSGDQENNDESIGDLAPEDLVPLDTAIALELVGTVGLETVGGLFGRETLEDRSAVVLCGLVNGEGVEGSLGLEINDFFTHTKERGCGCGCGKSGSYVCACVYMCESKVLL